MSRPRILTIEFSRNLVLELLFFGIFLAQYEVVGDTCFRETSDAQITDACRHPPFMKYLQEQRSIITEVTAYKDFYFGLPMVPNLESQFRKNPSCLSTFLLNNHFVSSLATNPAFVDKTLRNQKFMKKLFMNSKLSISRKEAMIVLNKENYHKYLAGCSRCLIALSKNKNVFSKLARNEEALNAMIDIPEFIDAIANNPKIKKNLKEKLSDLDTIREFIASHTPQELLQLLFEFNPKLELPIRIIFVIPVIFTWIGTLITVIVIWSACFPYPVFPLKLDVNKKKDKKYKKKNSDV